MFAYLKKFLPSILFAFCSSHLMAQGLDTIIDAQQMQTAIERGAIIWDVRDEKSYLEGHIKGAMNLGDAGVVLRDPNKEDYLPIEQIKKIFDAAGLDVNREVIVYGTRGNPYAYFALHTINYFGGSNAKIYHDGIDGWKTAGLAITKDRTNLAPVAVALVEQKQLMVSNEEMLSLYNQGNLQIVDVRTPDEYAGKDVRAIRGGHIPNAISIPFEENWQDPAAAIKLSKKQVPENSGMSLKNTLDLKKLYSKLDPNKETVVYCQSGVRASETSAVLKNLGFKNVKVYDSSWLGWGNNLNAPAEQETFLNVGALNAKITAMLGRINQLEEALKAKSH